MPKKICIIHPVDATTDFLSEIYSNIDESLLEVVRLEKKVDHFSFYNSLPEESTIIFLGHGTSNSLKGASTLDCEEIFMSDNQLAAFEKKDVLLFSCRSNQYIRKFYKTANINTGIGFPNMITDYMEISEYDDPNRAEGLTSEDIEIFKNNLVEIMRGSLNDFINMNLNIYQFYNRIILRTNKSILQYFKKNNGDEPLGKMLIDLRNGLVLKKN